MYVRDLGVIDAIHADRVRGHEGRRAPGMVPTPPPRRGVRRLVGRSLVRLGAWFAAERAETLLEPA
jgi:hypothetical protein